MRILRASSYRRMPWKNGGGETTEIAASPDGATLDTFDWRVSMADVVSSGPFSTFPGIDRTLAVLSGSGIRLRIDGIGVVELTAASAPFVFPADTAARADLVDGPIRDLNVMSRRGVKRHSLTRVAVRAPYRVKCPNEATLLLVQGGGAELRIATGNATLAAGDSALLETIDGDATLTPSSALTLSMCEFRRA